jgi:hypothetical protein
MGMPKTAMNKDCLLASRKDYIGLSRKVFSVKPIPKAHGVEQAPNNELRFRVFAFDGLHNASPLFWRSCIHL